jgi:hypothetical protein
MSYLLKIAPTIRERARFDYPPRRMRCQKEIRMRNRKGAHNIDRQPGLYGMEVSVAAAVLYKG